MDAICDQTTAGLNVRLLEISRRMGELTLPDRLPCGEFYARLCERESLAVEFKQIRAELKSRDVAGRYGPPIRNRAYDY